MAKSKKSEKKSKKKHKDSEHNRSLKKHKKSKKHKHKKEKVKAHLEQAETSEAEFAIPLELMNNKSHAPETPEEYEKRQSQIRREKDPITGRMRLIKGDGEVLEEIVSKVQHNTINKLATKGDGRFYEEKSLASAAKR